MSYLGYTIEIEWSEEDQCYVVSVPELASICMMPCTHGDTYQEASENAKEAIDVILMPDTFPLQVA